MYITTTKGEVVQQLPIRDSSASSLAIDLSTWRLLVSVMQSRGRSIHVFDISNRFKKVEVRFLAVFLEVTRASDARILRLALGCR